MTNVEIGAGGDLVHSWRAAGGDGRSADGAVTAALRSLIRVRHAEEVADVLVAFVRELSGDVAPPTGHRAGELPIDVGWGRFIAPKSTHRLDDPARVTVEITLFTATGVALVVAGDGTAGIVLALGSTAVAFAVRRSGQSPNGHHR